MNKRQKKAAYFNYLQKRSTESYYDINGNFWTGCDECEKKDCPIRKKDALGGCMAGELDPKLKETVEKEKF